MNANTNTTKTLSYQELIDLARKHYNDGGDGIVECWDENTYNNYVAEFGPMTEDAAMALFGCDADARADAEVHAAAAQTLTRSNKLTVKVSDGILQGDFFRTHKHLLTVSAPETGWTAPANANKTTERESFRLWLMEHAATYGILYDPTDRRTEANTRKATYKTEADVAEDAVAMVAPDIDTFVGKMPMADRISGHRITVESLTPKTHTSKGTDLSTMGIEDGKYASNGNLAWFDIEGVVTMDTAKGEIYQTIRMELVSGQLKKFRMTHTQWNIEVLASLLEAGVVTEEELAPKKEKKAKAEKSAKAKTPAPAAAEEKVEETPKYSVEYQVKAGHPRGEFHVETIEVSAQNAKEACKLAKEMVQATKGYNAFNPTATRI